VNGYNALVDDTHSPEKLAELIQKVIKDENLREEVVRNGFETAKMHDWERITDNWVKTLKEIEGEIKR
ncbi:glycosyl transferase, partial [Sulfolobus sp. F3]